MSRRDIYTTVDVPKTLYAQLAVDAAAARMSVPRYVERELSRRSTARQLEELTAEVERLKAAVFDGRAGRRETAVAS